MRKKYLDVVDLIDLSDKNINEIDLSIYNRYQKIKYKCQDCGEDIIKSRASFERNFLCDTCRRKAIFKKGVLRKGKYPYQAEPFDLRNQDLKNINFSLYTKEQLLLVTCPQCGGDIRRKKVTFNLTHLCRSCSVKNGNTEEVKEQRAQTNLKKYGVRNISQNKDVYAKGLKTKEERYGNPYFSNPEQTKQTKLEKYGDTTYNNKEQAAQTKLERYGDPHFVNVEKGKLTKLKKYGDPNYNNRQQFKQTCAERFGVPRPPTFKYEFQNEKFDSSWELAFWIFYKDHGALIEHEPIALEYIYNDEVHHYSPDFRIDNVLYEIKGSQFFDNGKMVCPFDRSLDDAYDAKYQCMIKNNVVIISNDTIMPYLDYVNSTYTSDFLSLFKTNLPFPYLNEDLQNKNDYGLIHHFHKSIYYASRKGCKSPYEAWKDKDLVLKSALNRLKYVKSCKPLDIVQGFNVAKIAPKVSIFKPSLAERLIKMYLNNYNQIFDPFSGFSGRMIGTMNSSKQYIGQDINEDHVRESNEIIQYKNYVNCQVIQQDILTDSNKSYECLFTCPPYGGKEHWNENNDEIEKSCDEWMDICLEKYKCKKYLFVVDQTEKYKDYIVETIENKSHFGSNIELVILI